jgi:hypothetical protein
VFKVLILVCSMSTPSQDCGWDNAVDVIVGPSATNELTCGFSGQAYLAGTALAPTDGSYVKVQCTRTAIVDRAPRDAVGDTAASSIGTDGSTAHDLLAPSPAADGSLDPPFRSTRWHHRVAGNGVR